MFNHVDHKKYKKYSAKFHIFIFFEKKELKPTWFTQCFPYAFSFEQFGQIQSQSPGEKNSPK